MNDTGMRLHIKCKFHREKGKSPRRKPKEINYEDHKGYTNIYDINLEELQKYINLFDEIEIVSFGKWKGTEYEKKAKEILK